MVKTLKNFVIFFLSLAAEKNVRKENDVIFFPFLLSGFLVSSLFNGCILALG